MPAGNAGFYAVIIICLIVFLSLSACLGIRLVKRVRGKNEEGQLATTLRPHEWQQLRSVTVDVVDSRVQQSVLKWQSKYPPNTTQYVDAAKQPEVIENGVAAWRFVETPTLDSEEESNAATSDEDHHFIVFCQGQGSIMTNLPVPMQEFSYWEVKILLLDNQDRLAVGFATKPYPRWRIPGWHRHSIAYHSNTGSVYASDPAFGRPYGPPLKEGDVVGIGYLYQSGTVFFTRNGQNLGKASIGFKYPVYPIIGSIGPCQVSTNFGHEDFLFSAANQREAAYAPRQGSLLPPPAYGGHTDDLLFSQEGQSESLPSGNGDNLTYIDRTLNPPPPSYS